MILAQSPVRSGWTCLLTCAALLGLSSAAQANINLVLVPRSTFGAFTTASGGCEQILIDLYAQSDNANNQDMNSAGVILHWDTTKLKFLGETNCTGSCPWFADGFFPDPDGINTDLDDGDAYYTALGNFGTAIPVSPAGLLITTFIFEGRGATGGTLINMPATQGSSAQTVVLDPDSADVTGDISSTVTLKIALVCNCLVGDVNQDDSYTFADLDAAVEVYLGNDVVPGHVTAADMNCDGNADGMDIQLLIDLLLLAI